jgi:hypothetical protein
MRPRTARDVVRSAQGRYGFRRLVGRRAGIEPATVRAEVSCAVHGRRQRAVACGILSVAARPSGATGSVRSRVRASEGVQSDSIRRAVLAVVDGLCAVASQDDRLTLLRPGDAGRVLFTRPADAFGVGQPERSHRSLAVRGLCTRGSPTLAIMETSVRQTAGGEWPRASVGQLIRVTVQSQCPGPNGGFRYLLRPALWDSRPDRCLPHGIDWTSFSAASNWSPRKSPPGSNVGIAKKPESKIQSTFSVSALGETDQDLPRTQSLNRY